MCKLFESYATAPRWVLQTFSQFLTSWAYSERENKLSEISKLKNLLRDLILIKSDGENFKWEVNLNKNLLST